jgi:hypothetical protein
MLGNEQIIKTWHGNRNKTIIFTIPLSMARSYNLDEPAYVVLEPMEEGFLRKLKESGI